MKLFSLSLTKGPSKLECLPLACVSGQIYHLQVRLERSLPEWSTFSGLRSRIGSLQILDQAGKVSRDEHSGLLVLFAHADDKKVS
jgi:hypothetical protein